MCSENLNYIINVFLIVFTKILLLIVNNIKLVHNSVFSVYGGLYVNFILYFRLFLCL